MSFKLHCNTIILYLLINLLFTACQSSNGNHIQTEETKAMIEELKKLVIDGDPLSYYHWNSKRADLKRIELERLTGIERNQIWYQYCLELLFAGKNEQSIEECLKMLAQYPGDLNEKLNQENAIIFEIMGTAYLRKGELANCQKNHNEFSCILPLQNQAVHQLKEGSQKAFELFCILNNKFPSERYQWLINLAAMTLGEYPKMVPQNAKIDFPNWNLENKNFPAFSEIAMHVGVAANGLSGGACMEDFNGDGFLDIFCTSYGMSDNVILYLNNGKGGFEDATEKAGLIGIVSGLNCNHADYDNDGDEDILILRGGWLGSAGSHPNSLLRNNGQGCFDEVSKSSGLYSLHPTQTASWGDFNKDGFLDVVIGNESGQVSHATELFQNNGDGTFKEVANKVGLGNFNHFVKGICFGDINNDLYPDIYISVQGGKNYLFKNNQGIFEDITEKSGVSEPIFSFPCWFFDVNNDGFEDIFVSGYDGRFLHEIGGDYVRELKGKPFLSEKPRLYINNGNETFTESSKKFTIDKTMYSMGSNFGDIDNDGYLDFYVGTGSPDFSSVVPNRMFRNINGTNFEEVTSAAHVGHIQKGHGVTFGDLDNDGDQDIYAVMGGAYESDLFTNVLFENPNQKNNWIVIELIGTKTNKNAIGTKLELTLENGQKIFRVVNTGGSFGSSSLQQEIGLGNNKLIKELKIYWQNAEVQTLTSIESNQKIIINETKAGFKKINYVSVPFAKNKLHCEHKH